MAEREVGGRMQLRVDHSASDTIDLGMFGQDW